MFISFWNSDIIIYFRFAMRIIFPVNKNRIKTPTILEHIAVKRILHNNTAFDIVDYSNILHALKRKITAQCMFL